MVRTDHFFDPAVQISEAVLHFGFEKILCKLHSPDRVIKMHGIGLTSVWYFPVMNGQLSLVFLYINVSFPIITER